MTLHAKESIYRLADKYNEAELKKKAYANIAASLTPANVLVELAHPFAGIFPEIKDLITTYAVQHWVSLQDSISAHQLTRLVDR